jgi:hypothetical protein
VLLGGQRTIDAGRGDLEHIRRAVDAIQDFRRRPRQRRDRVQIKGFVAVGDDRDAGWARGRIDDHIFDFVARARELAVE